VTYDLANGLTPELWGIITTFRPFACAAWFWCAVVQEGFGVGLPCRSFSPRLVLVALVRLRGTFH